MSAAKKLAEARQNTVARELKKVRRTERSICCDSCGNDRARGWILWDHTACSKKCMADLIGQDVFEHHQEMIESGVAYGGES